jgi:hypothetical protein
LSFLVLLEDVANCQVKSRNSTTPGISDISMFVLLNANN